MDEQQNQWANAIFFQMRQTAGYLARQEIDKINSLYITTPKRLEPYGYKVYSQNDEDGILHEIFKRLGISGGIFCEIGVENGLECNSLYLLHKGWRGAWIEANVNQKQPILDKFGSLIDNERLYLGIGYATPDNINSCIETPVGLFSNSQSDLDYLSIDVDGNDIYILEAINNKPKVICIEYNAKFPPPISKKPVFDPNSAWRGTDYMGSSLVAIDEVAKAKGYMLVATNITGANAFFVREDLTGNLFEEDSSPANLYNPPRYWLTADHFSRIGHPADFGPYEDLR